MVKKIFVYRAKNIGGKEIKGTVAADAKRDVAEYLCRRGYFVIELKEKRSGRRSFAFQGFGSVRQKDFVVMCRQMAVMLDAGIPLMDILQILIDQMSACKLRSALISLRSQIERGKSLADAMKTHGDIFPPMMVHMVASGEMGGVLHGILERLATHFEKDYKLKENLKTAMAYPVVLASLALLTIVFLALFVLPVFVAMFESMQVELPLPTRVLLAVSSFLQANGWSAMAALWAAAFAAAWLSRKPKCKFALDCFILQTPVFGKLAARIAVARFARALGALLSGGVPIVAAIGAARNSVGNLRYADALTKVQRAVEDGFTLSDSLKADGLFEPMIIAMLAVGEETGRLDVMLDKIADFYEDEIGELISRLGALAQPLILIVLGAGIGGIVVSVALPMLDSITYIAR